MTTSFAHSLLKRVNEIGVPGIYQCTDCGHSGSLQEMSRTPCDGAKKTPFKDALIEALEGDTNTKGSKSNG